MPRSSALVVPKNREEGLVLPRATRRRRSRDLAGREGEGLRGARRGLPTVWREHGSSEEALWVPTPRHPRCSRARRWPPGTTGSSGEGRAPSGARPVKGCRGRARAAQRQAGQGGVRLLSVERLERSRAKGRGTAKAGGRCRPDLASGLSASGSEDLPELGTAGTRNAAGFKAAFGTFGAGVITRGWQQRETELSDTRGSLPARPPQNHPPSALFRETQLRKPRKGSAQAQGELGMLRV